MDVVLIGAGNVGTVLGRTFKQANHSIKAIWNRHPEKARLLADELGTVAIETLDELPPTADLFLLSVSDRSISEIAHQLKIQQGVLVHAAGAVSKEVLQGAAENHGVFWPMKMIRSHMQSLGPCAIMIDANNEHSLQVIYELATTISDQVHEADDAKRLKMHLIAAITSNFTNHLYHLAADYSREQAIDFSWFYPLIEGVMAQIKTEHPQNVQAGPAFRGDRITIEKHRSLLAHEPSLLRIYDEMTQSILNKFGHQ
ncbi:MAG: DUF2520 domain-containing protein [Chitinophagaceae bacterium]|nr:DUF2520 domain-containing protein [Chitinophagaceae bacterium]